MNIVDSLPAELRSRAVAELVTQRKDDDYPLELIGSELEMLLSSAVDLLNLVVGASRAFSEITERTVLREPSLERTLRDVAGEVGADNAEIGQQEVLKYLHVYFSAGLATDLLTHLAGAISRPTG